MPTALIWGAGGGIGQALVELLTTEQWTVAAVSHRQPQDQTATSYRYEADVADDYAVERTVLAVAQELAPIDLWVYAVGDIAQARVADLNTATWQRLLDANLSGAWRTIHHSLPLLAQQAHLVFIGGYSERLQLPGLAAYAAAKAGLEAFVATLAKEERRRRVTLVRPAAIATPLWRKVPLRMPREAMAATTVARQILDAYHAGHSGQLDL